jgi:hypothetical protein
VPCPELFPFRVRDPLTRRWVRARYEATVAELEQRYGGGRYEITGPPEIRELDADARYFNPLRDEHLRDTPSIGNVGQILGVSRLLERQPRLLTVAGIAM